MPSRTAADSSVAPASKDAQMRFVSAVLSSVLRPGFDFDFISSAEAGTWTKRGGTWDRVSEILGIGSGLVPDWHTYQSGVWTQTGRQFDMRYVVHTVCMSACGFSTDRVRVLFRASVQVLV